MRSIADLFGKSPFGPIHEHLEKTKCCIDLIRPIFDELRAGNPKKIKEYGDLISKYEHEADKIKNEIRDNLPKSIFLPVARGDLTRLIKQQDSIADAAEDIAFLLQVRSMELPGELHEKFDIFLSRVLKSFSIVYDIVNDLDNLVEVSFDGPEAQEVLAKIKELGTNEWEADKSQFELLRAMFDIEDKMDPVSITVWMKLFNKIGDIANYSENTGDLMRMIIAS